MHMKKDTRCCAYSKHWIWYYMAYNVILCVFQQSKNLEDMRLYRTLKILKISKMPKMLKRRKTTKSLTIMDSDLYKCAKLL